MPPDREMVLQSRLLWKNFRIKNLRYQNFVKAEETYELTKQMLEEHPQIEGIYVSWDAPAKYVLNALTDMRREDIIVSTGDLEYNIALNLARGGMVKAISAQMPYEQERQLRLLQ